ncbi:fluoride efflux transporter CrcB [Halococcus hamelinensis]|uniref:Fluoride-specific ion channel FluC n=1 Tax=Halococcus hamelinensis 100A6 TaxID=1132509 RepID=M0M192_9EURY|nr:fluoride efflux transporter CrcB [Halococcus hamelinensis]EMA38155.1 integral membrane protein/crcB-like protein [Halococcus hamelinensis 100A6]
MIDIHPAHLVGTGGAIGALCRSYVGQRLNANYPLGTLTVNVVGSFVLGLVTFAGVGGDVALLVGTGACGSFTTFSSFSVETFQLAEADDWDRAVANAAANLVGSLGAIGLAWLLLQLVG